MTKRITTLTSCTARDSGASGGKRNAKSKYVASSSGASRAPRHGPAINLQQKLSDIAAESEWFLARPTAVREQLATHIAQMVEKQMSVGARGEHTHGPTHAHSCPYSLCISSDMSSTAFCQELHSMLLDSRRSMRCSYTDAADATNSSFDIVIYGIGRYADWSLGHAANDIRDAAAVTHALVRSALRSASRPPQLQLACILAVARSMHSPSPTTTAVSSSSSAAVDSYSVAPSICMYDPMLSELEKAIARTL